MVESRDAIYRYIQGVLKEASGTGSSSIIISDVLDAARSAFDAACADFAQEWNRQNSSVGVAGHLAPEILTNCFRFTDLESLVQATHVCRRWRALALAARALWASFRMDPRSFGRYDKDKAIEQLSVMLDRSRPVPFRLRLPWSTSSPLLEERLREVLDRDFSRLRSYTGPRKLYLHLNPHSAPMPHIAFIKFYEEPAYPSPGWKDLVFAFPSDWGTRGAPNLRSLTASMISIPTVCDRLLALRHLRFHLSGPSEEYHRVFYCCPNLVALDFVRVSEDSVLPIGPLPTTLDRVAFYPVVGVTVDFALLLASWSGRPIRRLVMSSAKSLSTALDIFLSWFQGPVIIIMAVNRVAVSLSNSGAQENRPHHIIYPDPWRRVNLFTALRGVCADRLASIVVPGDCVGDFFAARLIAPHLTSIEFHLDDSTARHIPGFPLPEFHLNAPRLRDVTVVVPFEVASLNSSWMCAPTVAALCQSLRQLIAYDATLLERITVRGAPDVVSLLACNRLAGFAQTYVEITDWLIVNQMAALNVWAMGIPDYILSDDIP